MAIINGNKLSVYDASGNEVGISYDEIAIVLGEPITTGGAIDGDDLGYLCTSSKINSAARCKPIDFPSLGILTDEQRKGYLGDQQDGIYFGLKCGTAISYIREIHTADWSYVSRPTGDLSSSPFRSLDFNGYHHTATLKVTGEGITDNQEVVISNPRLAVRIIWEHNNTTGVDIGEVFGNIGNGVLNYADMCVCIMVGTYVTAMESLSISTDETYDKYMPIVTDDADSGGFKYNDIYELPDILEDLGVMNSDITLPVTVFFVHKNDIDFYSGKWIDVSREQLQLSQNPITLPNCVNKSVNFVKESSSATKPIINFRLDTLLDEDVLTQYRIIGVSVTISSDTSFTLNDVWIKFYTSSGASYQEWDSYNIGNISYTAGSNLNQAIAYRFDIPIEVDQYNGVGPTHYNVSSPNNTTGAVKLIPSTITELPMRINPY